MEYGERQRQDFELDQEQMLCYLLCKSSSCFYPGKSVFVSGTLSCLVCFTSVASIKTAPVCSGIESSRLLGSNISHLGGELSLGGSHLCQRWWEMSILANLGASLWTL